MQVLKLYRSDILQRQAVGIVSRPLIFFRTKISTPFSQFHPNRARHHSRVVMPDPRLLTSASLLPQLLLCHERLLTYYNIIYPRFQIKNILFLIAIDLTYIGLHYQSSVYTRAPGSGYDSAGWTLE